MAEFKTLEEEIATDLISNIGLSTQPIRITVGSNNYGEFYIGRELNFSLVLDRKFVIELRDVINKWLEATEEAT